MTDHPHVCKKHPQVRMQCSGLHTANPDNWYCPVCESKKKALIDEVTPLPEPFPWREGRKCQLSVVKNGVIVSSVYHLSPVLDADTRVFSSYEEFEDMIQKILFADDLDE